MNPRATRKDCENRTIPPPKHLIGKRVALHAGRTYSVGSWPLPGGAPADADCPLGIVGTALLVGALDLRIPGRRRVVIADGVIEAESSEKLLFDAPDLERVINLDRSPWWNGPVGLLLVEPRALATPVRCNGQMGWWRVDAADARAVEAQEAARAA